MSVCKPKKYETTSVTSLIIIITLIGNYESYPLLTAAVMHRVIVYYLLCFKCQLSPSIAAG